MYIKKESMKEELISLLKRNSEEYLKKAPCLRYGAGKSNEKELKEWPDIIVRLFLFYAQSCRLSAF